MRLFVSILIITASLQALARDPVVVAVVDMGISSDRNEAIKPYLVPGWDFGGEHQSIGVDYNEIYENEYHGTLIAGLIIRNTPPTKLKILDLVYMDYKGDKFHLNDYVYAENMLQLYRRKRAYERFTEHLRDVFRFAKEQNASVINFSSSDPAFKGEELEKWIHQNSDTILVVSAGNDGDNLDTYPQYPCMYRSVICVGAVNKGKKTSYSNYGRGVTLYSQGTYSEKIKGTSFSAPVISRAVALLKYHHPEWSGPRIKRELLKYTYLKNGIKVFQEEKFTKKYY